MGSGLGGVNGLAFGVRRWFGVQDSWFGVQGFRVEPKPSGSGGLTVQRLGFGDIRATRVSLGQLTEPQ